MFIAPTARQAWVDLPSDLDEPGPWLLWTTDAVSGDLHVSCFPVLARALHDAWFWQDSHGAVEVDCLEGPGRRLTSDDVARLVHRHVDAIESLHAAGTKVAVYVHLPDPFIGERLVGTFASWEEAEQMAGGLRRTVGAQRVTVLQV